MSLGLPARLLAAALCFAAVYAPAVGEACCPAVPESGQPVVNADQTVIIVWDPKTKMQHFIRRASFASAAEDFGFIVPTPSKPELAEAGDAAFPFLQKLTEPEEETRAAPLSCGCTKSARMVEQSKATPVTVLEEKTVAGFDIVVLEASDAGALVGWLKEHHYAFSPEVETWAKPYIDEKWKFTAMRVAKGAPVEGAADPKRVAAAALRISFTTDRPLFPYREPDPSKAAATLGARQRLLRIYFLSDARYEGALGPYAWSGRVAYSDEMTAEAKKQTLELLKLPPNTGPQEWHLTEFEDPWPYVAARSDVYFAKSKDQDEVKRPPIIHYGVLDPSNDQPTYAVTGLVVVPLLWRLRRRRRRGARSNAP